MKKLGYILQWLAAVTLVTAHNLFALGGFKTAPLALAVAGDEQDINQQLLRAIGQIDARVAKIADIETQVKKNAADYEQVTKLVGEVQRSLLDVRKFNLEARSLRPRRNGEVTEECAKFLGGLAVVAGLRQNLIPEANVERYQDVAKRVLGFDDAKLRTALTSSDIPLPTVYSGEVAELVGDFSAARRWGTVFPLGGGTVKLPKLGTDTTFGLIAGSGTVTEKSPTVAWVTFTAEKFGGLVRLPSELDEDSIVPLGQFIARYSARQLAYIEDYNFFRSTGAGSGTNGTAEGLTKSVVTDSKTSAQASTKTKYSDGTLTYFRSIRAVCDAAALRMGAYYVHPSMEQLLASFNSSGDKPYQANGLNGATLDGFPVRWVDVMPAYDTSAHTSSVYALFGDVSFNYLGIRGGVRFDTSREAGFATDEILVRALERLTIGKMATGCVAGLITAAS